MSKTIEIIIEHWRANPELKKRIEEKFLSERERQIAWETIGIVREVFPETNDLFKGERIE